MYDHILVPLDGSELAERILPYATELAKCFGSRVVLLQVVETLGQAMATMVPAEPPALSPVAVETIVDAVEGMAAAAKRYLTETSAKLTSQGIQVEWRVISGGAGEEIVHFVETQEIDLVAIAGHGRSGVARAILGSVADHVVRHATVPVLMLGHAAQPS